MAEIRRHPDISRQPPSESLTRSKAVTLFVVAMITSMSQANDEGAGIEPKTRPTHLPPITALTIQHNGATSPASGSTVAQCATFKLSDQEVRHYLGKAAAVTEQDYFHMLDWSPCYASGKVTFKNGVTGDWSIQQYRAGSLVLNNGQTLYLYCPECQANAFQASDE